MKRFALALGFCAVFCAQAFAWGTTPGGVNTLNPQVLPLAGAPGLQPIYDNFTADGSPIAGGRCSEWGHRVPCTNHVSVTRASNGTDLRPDSASGFAYSTWLSNQLRQSHNQGALIEEARTNQLLNSTAPATQTTASLGTATYTLWVNGSGSAQMSAGTGTGCGTGTATNGTVVSFTITVAGTCTVTVTGSLNAFQLEAGTFGTSLIVTAGTTATRAADVPQLIGTALTAALNAKAMFAQTNLVAGTTGNNRLLSFNSNGIMFFSSSTLATIQSVDTLTSLSATLGAASTYLGLVKAAYGFDASGMSTVANGGTKASNATAFGTVSGSAIIGNVSGGNRALNGYYQRFALSPIKGIFDNATR